MNPRQKQLLRLLEEAGPALYGALVRLTLRQDVAEDLMQDLFAKLCESPGFAAARNPAAYAQRAAVHLAFNWRRGQKRKRDGEAMVQEPAAEAPSPLWRLVQAEQVEQVLGALDELSELSRDVVVMRFIEEQSYETIADELGQTPHQVRALCYKGLVRLRQLMRGPAFPVSGQEVFHGEP